MGTRWNVLEWSLQGSGMAGLEPSPGRVFGLVSTVAAVAAGVAVRNALHVGFELASGEPAPKNPAARQVTWPRALVWSALVGAVVGLARTMARRGAAAGWDRFGDSRAPVKH